MTIDPRIVAHRGFCVDALENTLRAFDAAIALGCHGIELDVRRTVDDEWVVHHDPTLERIHGIDLVIATTTLAKLESVRDVVSLETVLDHIPDAITLFVENKETTRTPIGDERIVELIERRSARGGGVAIITHGDEWTRFVADRAPQLTRLVFEMSWQSAIDRASQPDRHPFHGFDLDHRGAGDTKLSPRQLVGRLAEFDRDICLWTVNDPELARTWLDAGVPTLITDRPDLVHARLVAGGSN